MRCRCARCAWPAGGTVAGVVELTTGVGVGVAGGGEDGLAEKCEECDACE